MRWLFALIMRLMALVLLFSGFMALVAGGFVWGIILLVIGFGCIWVMKRRRRTA